MLPLPAGIVYRTIATHLIRKAGFSRKTALGLRRPRPSLLIASKTGRTAAPRI
jgi:hypothetical protein